MSYNSFMTTIKIFHISSIPSRQGFRKPDLSNMFAVFWLHTKLRDVTSGMLVNSRQNLQMLVSGTFWHRLQGIVSLPSFLFSSIHKQHTFCPASFCSEMCTKPFSYRSSPKVVIRVIIEIICILAHVVIQKIVSLTY